MFTNQLDFERRRAIEDLGKVRPEQVKRIAKELLVRFPNRFSTSFEDNKKTLQELAEIGSQKLRNRIAGYITHLVSVTYKDAKSEEEG